MVFHSMETLARVLSGDTISPTFIATSAFVVVSTVLLIWIIRLELKLHAFMKGSSGKSLESHILSIRKGHEDLTRFRRELEQYLEQVEVRLARSLQGVHTVRFNPFKGSGLGGNQSFATALVNEHGNGVVLSSIYARDHVSIFSKPVQAFASPNELSEEERNAIEEARKTLAR